MPYLKVYIHFVWTTKNREPSLATPELRSLVWNHILENSFNKKYFIEEVNGHSNHCHCLVSLNSTMSISQVVRLIKGESSHWINMQKLCDSKFEWQNDYWGTSIGITELSRIWKYIKNQEEHHKNKSFDEKCLDQGICFND